MSGYVSECEWVSGCGWMLVGCVVVVNLDLSCLLPVVGSEPQLLLEAPQHRWSAHSPTRNHREKGAHRIVLGELPNNSCHSITCSAPRLDRGLGEHVVQVDHLVSAVVSDYDEHSPLTQFHSIFNQSPDSAIHLLPHCALVAASARCAAHLLLLLLCLVFLRSLGLRCAVLQAPR